MKEGEGYSVSAGEKGTPRTDAFASELYDRHQRVRHHYVTKCLRFCKLLERELAALQAERDRLREAAERFNQSFMHGSFSEWEAALSGLRAALAPAGGGG